MVLKFTSSSVVRKIFQRKCGHNLLPGKKSRFDSTNLIPNRAECGVKYDKFHLLMNWKNLNLYQNNLKTMVNDTLQKHCGKSVTMNMDIPLERLFCQKRLPYNYYNLPYRTPLITERHIYPSDLSMRKNEIKNKLEIR